MVHLGVLYLVSLEASFLKLPIEMIAAVFEDVTQSDIFIGILKIVEDGHSKGHIHYISEAIEIRSCADENAAWS